MDVKNIKSYLTGRHNAWLKSIEDEELRKEVKKHSLIAGGAIASLIQGEQPNDIDIYLSDEEVALKLVIYYIKKWNGDDRHTSKIGIRTSTAYKSKEAYLESLQKRPVYNLLGLIEESNFFDDLTEDIQDKLDRMEKYELIDVIKDNYNEGLLNGYDICTDNKELSKLKVDQLYRLNEYSNGVSLFIRSSGVAREPEAPDDGMPDSAGVAGSEESAKEDTESPDYRPVFLTDNAISLKGKVQIILRFIGTPEEIVKNFDYVHCTCTYVPWNRKLSLPNEALASMMTKELVYVGSRYPICSLFRMRKFLARGYHLNVGQVLKMVFQIKALNLYDVRVLEDQLLGVDTVFMKGFIDRLKEQVKKDKLGDSVINPEQFEDYVTKIVSEMFDSELSN